MRPDDPRVSKKAGKKRLEADVAGDLKKVIEKSKDPVEVLRAKKQLYAFHRHVGATGEGAIKAAGLANLLPQNGKIRTQASYIGLGKQLDQDPEVQEAIRFLFLNPKMIARGAVPLILQRVLWLALNAKSERTQLDACIAILDRGGLPARTEVVTGDEIDKLAKSERAELESRLVQLFAAARERGSEGDSPGAGVEKVQEKPVLLPE